jgi:hypothetical protein
MVALEFVLPLRVKEFFMLAVVERTETVIAIFLQMVALAVVVILGHHLITLEMGLPTRVVAVAAVVMEPQQPMFRVQAVLAL